MRQILADFWQGVIGATYYGLAIVSVVLLVCAPVWLLFWIPATLWLKVPVGVAYAGGLIWALVQWMDRNGLHASPLMYYRPPPPPPAPPLDFEKQRRK